MADTGNLSDDLDATVRESAGELADFMDIEYVIDLRVGNAHMTVRDLLGLATGDQVKLNRRVSENLLLMVEDTVIAEAEVFRTANGTSVRVIELS